MLPSQYRVAYCTTICMTIDQCTRLVRSFLSTVLWAYFWILNPPFKQSFNAPHTHVSRIYLGNLTNLWLTYYCTASVPVPSSKCIALTALYYTIHYLRFCVLWSQVQQAAEKYASLLNDSVTVVNSEYILWRQQWTATAVEQRPDTATSALSSCSNVKFPNVYRLLTILGTLPVTTCESECVFTKLQRSVLPRRRID